MKKNPNALNEIKQELTALKGNTLNFKINRGRKKIEDVIGTIDCLYPSVFTIKIEGSNVVQTFSYFDVLCGLVNYR